MRILLVEDDEMNRDMLSRRLVRLGVEVIMATDGAQAVLQAQQANPDLILMDMSLPVMDGWEATYQIHSRRETRHIPIIGLSSHAMAGDRGRAIAAGCVDYDTKPVDLKRLLGKIEQILPNRIPSAERRSDERQSTA